MKIIVKLGNNPDSETFYYTPCYCDDISLNMKHIDSILNKNVTILGVDHYLLYYINNLIMRYVVSTNVDTPIELKTRLNLNPKDVKVIEVDGSGNEKCIQDEYGLIDNNYFDTYMKFLMDDFYKSVNYFL